MKTAVFVLTFVVLSMIIPQADAKGDIDVSVDHDVADTWSQVLILITSEPIRANNTSYHIDRNLSVEVVLLDEHRTVLEFEILLANGTANFKIHVVPDFGEGIVEIRIYDNFTATITKATFRTIYSTKWAVYLATQSITETIVKPLVQDIDEMAVRVDFTSLVNFILVCVLVPLVILRWEHLNARKHHKSSIADRLRERILNYRLVPPALWHYVDDPKYEFDRASITHTKAAKLRKSLHDIEQDKLTLTRVEDRINAEISNLEYLEDVNV